MLATLHNQETQKMKLLSLFMIAILFLQVVVDVSSSVSDAEKLISEKGGDGDLEELMKKHRRPTINCHNACARRCSKSSRKNVCHRACKSCCATCHCVPPGTYGNKGTCPCYAKLKTHGNKPKCP